MSDTEMTYHTTIDCLFDCEVLPKLGGRPNDFDQHGITAALSFGGLIVRVEAGDEGGGFAFRRSCDEVECGCPLDGTEEGLESVLWAVINNHDLTNTLTSGHPATANRQARRQQARSRRSGRRPRG